MPQVHFVGGGSQFRKGQGQHFAQAQIPKFGSLTPNDTTETEYVPVPHESVFIGGAAVCTTLGDDADGDILIYLCKWDKAASAEVVLTEGLDAQAMVVKETSSFVIKSDLTDAQQTFRDGDSVYAKAVSDSAAIDVQPVALHCTVVLAERK